MRQKYFAQPFANIGDLTAIPDTVDPGGAVSFPAGWGFNYQRDLATDALALPINRATTNYLFNTITAQLQQYQQFGAPEWISTANNDGTPFAYDFGAKVRYSAGNAPPFLTYVSVLAGQSTNTSVPGADANWKLASVGNVDKFNATYAAAIGGYPQGAMLLNNAGTALYLSVAGANTTDFNAFPASIPAQWAPAAGNVMGALSGGNQWAGPQGSTPVAVTFTSTITLNLAAGNNFVVGPLTGNIILANPSLSAANYGQSGAITFLQDATGSRVISSFGSAFLRAAGSYPNITAGASGRDKLFYYVDYDGKISINARNNES